MSFVTLLNSYLTFNFLLAFGFVFFSFLKVRASLKLKLQYFTISLFAFMSLIQPLLPRPAFTNSTIKVWAAGSMDEVGPEMSSEPTSIVTIDTLNSPQILSHHFSHIFLSLLGVCFLLGIILLYRELLSLNKFKTKAMSLRTFGKVKLLIGEEIKVPFSYWIPGSYYSFFPTSLLNHPGDFKVALYHELQHHRQLDTVWVYPLLLIRCLCFINPFAHLLVRQVNETQELSCDEVLIETKNISITQYTGCLLRVAQTIVSRNDEPVCAAGLCFNKGRHILKRRIQMMNDKYSPSGKWTKGMVTGLVTVFVTMTAFGSRNFVQDRKVTQAEAKALVDKASLNTNFPIVLNDQVLAQLNRYLGTPEGRNFMKASLKRKQDFDSIIQKITQNYANPNELNAIPIPESGYQNLPARGKVSSAGLWMFIPATARNYGMKIKDGVDERLDITKETDAAHRYLQSNNEKFKDWLLAIFAYNVGEQAVERGIKKYGTRDPWELSKHIRGDKDYMSKVMASIIIMKNPEVLDQ
jgi:membrane-bound lytic murein transglycosylase D